MTEWEQIKKEYREINVPAEGPHQVLTAMAEAKRKRNRYKRLAQYATVAAAALLVIVLLPGIRLFSGGFGSTDNMTMDADFATQNAGSGWFAKNEAADMAPAVNSTTTAAPEEGYASTRCETEAAPETPNYGMDDAGAVMEDTNIPNEDLKQAKGFTEEERDVISKEIIKQMEERMQKTGETYYIKSETYPEGFEQIEKAQEYYVNADGLFVIVFRAGVVAPIEQGLVEFVIPAEVTSP